MIAPVFHPCAQVTPKVEAAAATAIQTYVRDIERKKPALPNNNPGRRGPGDIDPDRLRELVETGMTSRQIAKALNCSKDWVFRLSARHNLRIGRARNKQQPKGNASA